MILTSYKTKDRLTINPLFLKKIGSGTTTKGYKINRDESLKIYKKPQDKFKIEDFEAMININTKRILLPTDFYTNEDGKLIAYKMPYISKGKILDRISKETLVEELKKIEEEKQILTENNIIIVDWKPENIIFNKGIYIIDPGSYYLAHTNINLEKINNYTYSNFAYENLLVTTDTTDFERVFEYIDKYEGTYSKMIEEQMKGNEKLSSFKRKF